MGPWIALLLLAMAVIALVLRPEGGSIAGLDPNQFAGGAAGLALVVFYLSRLLGDFRDHPGERLRQLGIWAVIMAGLVAAYAYRGELSGVADRIGLELSPAGTEQVVSDGTEAAVRLRKALNGHFMARVRINGASVVMMVDTGATGIVLKPSDAERAGIDVGALDYTVPVQTANGGAMAAATRLDTVAIGPIGFTRMEALVAAPGALDQSLLGISFLSRLRSYEFSGDTLTLRR